MNSNGSAARNDLSARLRQHPFRVLAGLLLLALLILILLWDWNWMRGPIERVVQAKTGRDFDIGGNLDVDLGRTTTVRMDALRFGNAKWSKQGDMAVSDRVEFKFQLWPAIFKRQFILPELRLTKPSLKLELGPDGEGNWSFGDEGDASPEFRNLWIDDGRLKYLDAKGKTDIDIAMHSQASRERAALPQLVVDGGGRWKGNRFILAGTAESPLELQNTEQPYRIDLRAAAGSTHAHARGTLLDPVHFRDFNLQLALSGQNMDDLYPLIGVAIPPTPPYSLDGKLTRVINNPGSSTWKYDGFSGTVGNSDLAGFAHVTTAKRVLFEADFRSKRLDFDDLAGFIGGAPQAGGGEKTNPELQAQAAKQAASPRLLPDDPYELDKLRTMDADVRLRAARVNAPSLPLDDMDAHLFLKNGVLRLEPLNFGLADGELRSNIRMDATESPLRVRADVTATRLTLAKLMPGVKLVNDAVGKVGGKISLAGTGNSIAKMLATSNGDITVGMGSGRISKLLMEYAGLDLAGILKIKLTGDKQIAIRCTYGDFGVRNGVMTTRAFAFDTDSTLVTASGDINLRDETLDLTVQPRPKGFSPLSLRSPLYVRGTFKDPAFKPDYARIGLRGAAALALGTLAAPAALIATTNLGKDADGPCASKAK